MDLCNFCKYTKKRCICDKNWYELENVLNKNIKNDLESTNLKVSTMTICFKMTNCKEILLNQIPELYSYMKIFTICNYTKGAKKSKNKIQNNVMYNQCELKGFIKNKTDRSNKISLMIFRSGAFKLVGIKNVTQIPMIIRIVDNFLKQNKLITINKSDEDVFMTNVRICMINTNFQIFPNDTNKQKIHQQALKDHLVQKKFNITNKGPLKSCVYDQDIYPGVKIKYVYNYDENKEKYKTRKGREKLEGEVSIFVFGSGKIIITGGKTANEIYDAYKFINRILSINKTKLLI